MDLLTHRYLQLQMTLANPFFTPQSPLIPMVSLNPLAHFPLMPFFSPPFAVQGVSPLQLSPPFASPSVAEPSTCCTPPSSAASSVKSSDSDSQTPKTVPGRRAMTFCRLCNKNLAERKRSQGPTRHVLKDHFRVAIYQCPHCNYNSSYDATQVVSHIKRNHSGKRADIKEVIDNKKIYREAIDAKMRECFGKDLHDNRVRGARSPKTQKAVEKEDVDVVNV